MSLIMPYHVFIASYYEFSHVALLFSCAYTVIFYLHLIGKLYRAKSSSFYNWNEIHQIANIMSKY